ncbi:bifunctional metallophosphatase/5'-nucleotidase [Maridesulfovibrio sp. FT414]|uniref:bifunctional metallophosphatase/5'-nucleotidase n=1 Tax=Maridesulfovibrio sp. FT414 TaxID=2979469 RepID=UPI003D807F87
MGFDASTLGNHEFDRGTNFLIKCLENKNFPTIASNINIPHGNKLQKFIQSNIIIEKNYLKVGIIGMVLPALSMISNPGPDISVDTNIIESARATALKLRHDGANLVVLLSHLNIDDQAIILENVPEVDIVCGGQSHKDILPGQEIVARDALTPGLLVQCGSHGRFVGVLKVKMKNGLIDHHEWTIIPVTDQVESDPKIASYIESQTSRNDFNEVLTNSPVEIDTRVELIRISEAPVGKLVTNIMRERFKTDIAFQNSGGIRGNKKLPSGPISGSDVNQMFPFGNTITILKVTGKELKEILERSVHKLPAPSGAFLHTSGIQYSLDLTGTPQELEFNDIGKPVSVKTPGTRISDIKVLDGDGVFHPINPDKKYSITTNSFLARGGDGFLTLKDASEKVETFIKVRDVIKLGLLDMKEIRIKNNPYVFTRQGTPFFQ